MLPGRVGSAPAPPQDRQRQRRLGDRLVVGYRRCGLWQRGKVNWHVRFAVAVHATHVWVERLGGVELPILGGLFPGVMHWPDSSRKQPSDIWADCHMGRSGRLPNGSNFQSGSVAAS